MPARCASFPLGRQKLPSERLTGIAPEWPPSPNTLNLRLLFGGLALAHRLQAQAMSTSLARDLAVPSIASDVNSTSSFAQSASQRPTAVPTPQQIASEPFASLLDAATQQPAPQPNPAPPDPPSGHPRQSSTPQSNSSTKSNTSTQDSSNSPPAQASQDPKDRPAANTATAANTTTTAPTAPGNNKSSAQDG